MSNKNYGFSMKAAAVSLVLLAVGLGITAWLYTGRTQEAAITLPLMEEPAEEAMVTEAPFSPAPSVPAAVTEAPSAVSVPSEVPVMQTEPEVTQQTALRTVSPVSGSTIGEYAMDCLSYNETTRDWRIHNGIDLAAAEGTPVSAAADGTVYTVYEDDTLGNTVVLRHAGGYTTRYSSLGEDIPVKPGDTVTMGQTIGYAADTALVETVMGSHVHFSVSCQDIAMDPEEFLALGK